MTGGDDLAMPLDSEAESKTLGVLLTAPEAFSYPEVERLRTGEFDDVAHQRIFTTLRGMRATGKPIEAIARELRERGWLESCGGPDYIGQLVNRAPIIPEDVKFWAEKVSVAAAKRELFSIGGEIQKGACNGQAVAELMQSAAGRLKDLEARAVGTDDVELLSAADLSEGAFTLDYHVAGVLVKGQPTIVAAPQKSLKTSVCVDLALSLASGTKLLGHWPTTQTGVLMLSGESGLGTLQETARRICHSKNIILSIQKGFTLSTWIPRFDNAANLSTLARIIDKCGAQVLIVDPAYLCMTGDDAGNLFKMGEALRGVTDVANRAGVTLVLVHHTRKNVEIGTMPELSWIGWSGFSEFARQWVLLNRREFYQPGTGEHRLWMVAGGSAGHGGAWGLDIFEGLQGDDGGRIWAPTVRSAGDVSREAQQARAVARIDRQDEFRQAREAAAKARLLDALAKHGPMTAARIRTVCRLSGATAKVMLSEMVESGDLITCQVDVKGAPYDGFSLPPGQPWTSLDGERLSSHVQTGRTNSPYRGLSSPSSVDGGEFMGTLDKSSMEAKCDTF